MTTGKSSLNRCRSESWRRSRGAAPGRSRRRAWPLDRERVEGTVGGTNTAGSGRPDARPHRRDPGAARDWGVAFSPISRTLPRCPRPNAREAWHGSPACASRERHPSWPDVLQVCRDCRACYIFVAAQGAWLQCLASDVLDSCAVRRCIRSLPPPSLEETGHGHRQVASSFEQHPRGRQALRRLQKGRR